MTLWNLRIKPVQVNSFSDEARACVCVCAHYVFFGLRAKKKKAGQLDKSARGTCPEKLAFVLFIF